MIFKRLTNSEDKIYEKAMELYSKSFSIYEQRLPEMRGRGCGAQALSLLGERKKTVILEIDPPNDEVSVRRKAFYERAGYRANPFEHIHPPYHSEYKGHRLVVMTCPTTISENEYKNFNSYLENVVMKNNITGIFRHFQQTTTNFLSC